MPKRNIMGLVQGDQDVINTQARDVRNYGRVKGVLAGLSSLAAAKRNAKLASDAQTNLSTQINDVLVAADTKGLSALEKLGLQQQANKLQMLRDNVNYRNVEKLPEMYGAFFEKQPDVLKLATELKKADVQGRYGIEKAKIYGEAQGKAFRGINFPYEKPKTLLEQAGNMIQGVTGLFPGQAGDVQNLFAGDHSGFDTDEIIEQNLKAY